MAAIVTTESTIIIRLPAMPWSAAAEMPQRRDAVPVPAVRRPVRPSEHVREDHAREARDDDVEELRARSEPLRSRQRLEHGSPEKRAGSEERCVLERVDPVVGERRLVEVRQVPEVERHRPERQSDERVREHAEALDDPVLENRSEERAGQAGDDQDRRHLAEEDVLCHVDEEELLLPDASIGEKSANATTASPKAKDSAARR